MIGMLDEQQGSQSIWIGAIGGSLEGEGSEKEDQVRQVIIRAFGFYSEGTEKTLCFEQIGAMICLMLTRKEKKTNH